MMKYDPTEESITAYKTYNNPKPVGYFSMNRVIELIKSRHFKEASEQIRDLYAQEGDHKGEIEALKKKHLGGVGFPGRFSRRHNKQGLIESSGLAVLDFDNGPCPEQMKPYILLQYKSPRGRDKVVVRIPLVKNDEDYKSYFRAIQYFVIKCVFGVVEEKNVEKAIKTFKGSPLDGSGCDISRFTYLSYDPEPYFNPDCLLWTQRFVIDVKKDGVLMKEPDTSQAGPLKKLQELFHSYHPGQTSRHEICMKVGRTAGGWVAGGLLNKEEVFTLAHNAIYTINDGDEIGARDDLRTFNDLFIIGMQQPMNDYHEKNTIKLVQGMKIEVKVESSEDERMKKAMEAIEWEDGDGFLTGWDTFDQYYKIFLRTSTLIYSQPNVGKTLWLFTMAVWMAKTYGWKWFVYSPETGREGTIALRLAEVYTGKDATRKNQMNREELVAALTWVHAHFFIYERAANQPRPSVDDILQATDKFMATSGIKINAVIIDTLSNTTIETGEKHSRIDLAYESMLDSLNQWMFDRDAHVFLTSHMVNTGHIAVDKATGHLIDPTPNFTMIKGGQALPRMGFNVIALHQHRPATFEPDGSPIDYNGNLYYNNSFYAIIQKIKPFYVGRRGMIHFRVDHQRHRIYDADSIQVPAYMEPIRDTSESQNETKREIQHVIDYDKEAPDWAK